MEQYISKSALVAELEKRIKVSQDYAKCNLTEKTRIGNHAQQLELNDILAFINTLETKEADLDNKDKWKNTGGFGSTWDPDSPDYYPD